MHAPDVEPYRRAERLEWHAFTVFDGDQPGGDGNVDGQLRAINGSTVVATVPLDIFTPKNWSSLVGTAPAGPWWMSERSGPIGVIVADPRSVDEVREQIRRWCRRAVDREDVVVVLGGASA